MAKEEREEEQDLLKRPVYAYDIPPELLETFVLRTDHPATPEENQPATTTIAPQDADTSSSTSCALCKITNKNVAEQRAHARSDIHNFNLKRKVRGQPAVAEAEFEDLLEGLNESISGSDSSSSEDESGPTDQLSVLLKRNAILANPDDEPTTTTAAGWKQGAGKAPIIWFNSPLLPAETSLGVYRAIFTKSEQSDALWLDALRSKQLAVQPKGKEPHIFMCMIGGGHFAAMVVSLAPKVAKMGGERSADIIAHKTFHRYTTRRKQGGAQSTSDAAKGAAHSAGSSLRRYNEVALTAEIRELLTGWKEWLDTADLLFVRAVGNSNRRTLFGEGAPLKSNDPRIRGFPFSTRRATQSELMRCFVELTRMKTSTLTSASLSALSSAPASIAAPATPKPKLTAPRLTPAEESAHMHSTQLTALIRRSKAPALLSYLTTHSLSPNYTFSPPNHHSPTLLHFAASSSSPAVVTALLTKARADPTLTTPAQPRPAFELCGDRTTRDAFRVARHELGEAAWDWGKACVPPALSRAEADEREKCEKAGEEAGERQRREREVARLQEEARRKAAESRRLPGRGGRNLGGPVVQMGMGRREEEEGGLTKEARVKLERERRARAAEERIRRLAG